MVANSEKTYGQLMQEAAAMTDTGMEVGDIVGNIMTRLKKIVEDTAQFQYEACMEKGFNLPKYYIHIYITKELLAANAMDAPNTLHIRKPHCRVTRPSPYQDEDHYLWSVENYTNIKFEWCIPNKETMRYILSHAHEFDINYVKMLKQFANDKLEKIEDYLVEGKVI